MKTKLLALLLLAGSTVFAGPRFFVGVGVGGGYYAPAPVAVYAAPPAPVAEYAPGPYVRPGYSWVGGYWYPSGPRYAWHTGYYARAPYAGAYWAAPRYYGHRYYPGYWRR